VKLNMNNLYTICSYKCTNVIQNLKNYCRHIIWIYRVLYADARRAWPWMSSLLVCVTGMMMMMMMMEIKNTTRKQLGMVQVEWCSTCKTDIHQFHGCRSTPSPRSAVRLYNELVKSDIWSWYSGSDGCNSKVSDVSCTNHHIAVWFIA